jgi:hypothetical protein
MSRDDRIVTLQVERSRQEKMLSSSKEDQAFIPPVGSDMPLASCRKTGYPDK